MKKYLMTGIAALSMCFGFTSCSHDFDNLSQEEIDQMKANEIVENYKKAFVAQFGQPAADQDWGFGTSATRGITRSNPGETYPATEDYHNMNHNEWADPDKKFGGYNVPDPLTKEQKALVAAYFQSVPNLTYEDPHLRHFFIQQVYKGGKVDDGKKYNTIEGITAANGTKYDSDNMNLLSVGQSNIHINNFNAGDCSKSNVLDNGQKVGGTEHEDQITLMVNIDDTSCFGYHETGSSTQHNNKAALVSWQTIRAWARQKGIYTEDILNDGWDRSFLGFDLAIKEGAQAQSDVAAKYNDGPESYSYAKIGGQIVSIDGSTNILYNNQNIYYLDTNTNMYVAAESKTIGDGDIQAEYRVNGQYMGKYLNVDYLMSLINDGWLPVKDKNFREWVKVGKSDGYFSDWIVTLTNATKTTPPDDYSIRVIAEDLTFGKDLNTDFDFNDVVFDVCLKSNETKIRLKAAGGTLPLIIGVANPQNDQDYFDNEVHNLFGVAVNVMVNTNAHLKGLNSDSKDDVIFTLNTAYTNAKNIPVYVKKNGTWVELTAVQGEPASKIGVDINFQWVNERQSMKGEYPLFVEWVQADATFRSQIKWW
jgi:hypothetical protein